MPRDKLNIQIKVTGAASCKEACRKVRRELKKILWHIRWLPIQFELLTVQVGNQLFFLLGLNCSKKFLGIYLCGYAAQKRDAGRSILSFEIGEFVAIRRSGIRIELFGRQWMWLRKADEDGQD